MISITSAHKWCIIIYCYKVEISILLWCTPVLILEPFYFKYLASSYIPSAIHIWTNDLILNVSVIFYNAIWFLFYYGFSLLILGNNRYCYYISNSGGQIDILSCRFYRECSSIYNPLKLRIHKIIWLNLLWLF